MPPLTLTIRPRSMGWTLPRPRKLGFMHLPREVRNQIYEYALVEPMMRWDKTHEFSCHVKTCKPGLAEPPPFLVTEVAISANPWKINTFRWCQCATRRAISLLAANCQIHEEAAPMFWSRNKFCFLHGFEAYIALGHLIRPEYRDLIHYVSVMNPNKYDFSFHTYDSTGLSMNFDWGTELHLFWETISECKGLTNLQVHPLLIDEGGKSLWSFLMSPGVDERLRIETVLLSPFSKQGERFATCFHDEDQILLHYSTIYAKVVRLLTTGKETIEDFDTDSDTDSEADSDTDPETDSDIDSDIDFVPDFDPDSENYICRHLANISWDVQTEIENTLKGHFWVDNPDDPNWEWWVPLHQGAHRKVRLSNGTKSKVEYYGLPATADTIMQASRLRQARDAEQRARNGLTVAQNEAKEESRERKREHRRNKQASRKDLVKAYTRAYQQSFPARPSLQVQRQKAALKATKKSEKRNAEARAKERKRVQPGSKKTDERNLLSGGK